MTQKASDTKEPKVSWRPGTTPRSDQWIDGENGKESTKNILVKVKGIAGQGSPGRAGLATGDWAGQAALQPKDQWQHFQDINTKGLQVDGIFTALEGFVCRLCQAINWFSKMAGWREEARNRRWIPPRRTSTLWLFCKRQLKDLLICWSI